jgi:hypothetical protein
MSCSTARPPTSIPRACPREGGVLAWLARHLRWTFHFTPTSASWLNAVENFFSKMTRQRIRRGVFHSIADLQAAINAYLAEQNASAQPFVWTETISGQNRPLLFAIRLIQSTSPNCFSDDERTDGDLPLFLPAH